MMRKRAQQSFLSVAFPCTHTAIEFRRAVDVSLQTAVLGPFLLVKNHLAFSTIGDTSTYL